MTDGKRVYAYFGNVGLFTYDMEGNLLWKKDLGRYRTAYNWGTASSPVLHGDRVYIVNDNEEHSFVAAFDAKTGKEIWKVDRDEKSNWATPYVWENDLRTELVTCGKKKVRSYSLDGKLLWELGRNVVDRHSHSLFGARAALRHVRLRDEHSKTGLCDQAGRERGHFAQGERDVQPVHRLVSSEGGTVQRLADRLRQGALRPL